MAFLNFCSICFLTVFLAGVASDTGSTNFPLDGCSTDTMDVLFLYYPVNKRKLEIQTSAAMRFADHLSSFPSNKTFPRVMFASVYDKFSANNQNVNVSSWLFGQFQLEEPYGYNGPGIQLEEPYGYNGHYKHQDLREVIKPKTEFIQRLFSEMGGVRENVTRVAVMFLHNDSSPFGENTIENQHVQELDTAGIQIFPFVINFEYATEYDKLRFPIDYRVPFYQNFLIVRLCSQCTAGWFSFHRSRSDVSCYMFHDTGYNIPASEVCGLFGGMFLAIETREELRFLQTRIGLELRNRGNISLAHVDIGLYGNEDNSERRFHWKVAHSDLSRPLVVNHWLPGKPSPRYINRCVVWQFEWSDLKNDITNFSSNEGHFVDGWANVECKRNKTRYAVCEASIPSRFQDTALITIKPVSDESISHYLGKGEFVNDGDNIVSVSSHIASTLFRTYLKNIGFELFPLFDCGEETGDNRYISYMFVCDSLHNCSNRRDEDVCVSEENVISSSEVREDCRESCKGVYCCDGSCLALRYANDGQVECSVCRDSVHDNTIDESDILDKYLTTNEACAFICYNGKCVFSSELASSLNDCYETDRQSFETTYNSQISNTCKNILGRNIWPSVCIFSKDKYGAVLDCRRMSHLEDCVDFVCPEGYVKCPKNYCIPQHYVRDGQADCPQGEDENIENIGSCTGNFKCWDNDVCLNPDLVCDGHRDCPHGDDELDCKVECPAGFRCISGTVTSLNNSARSAIEAGYKPDKQTRYIDLSGVDLSDVTLTNLTLAENVRFIVLSNCSLTTLSLIYIYSLTLVQYLDLSHNNFLTFDCRAGYCPFLPNIRYLNLSYNRHLILIDNLPFPLLEVLDISFTGVSYLRPTLFWLVFIDSLKHVNLSYTYLTDFEIFDMCIRCNFIVLDIRGLSIETFKQNAFYGLTISQHLYTDRFEMCCAQIRGPNIPSHKCLAPAEAISSCYDLVGDNIQRVLLFVVATFAVLGNMTVIVYRVIWDRSVLKTCYGLFLTNLSISDFIMGVYMFIIVGADYYYRGSYVLYSNKWKYSIVCRLAGFMASLSTETSILFVFLITLDIYLVMKFPFGKIKLSKRAKVVAVLMSWTIGIILSLIPIVFNFEIYSSNAMCIGLPLTNRRLKGWQFSFGVFIVLNLFLCVVVAYGQISIYRAMAENRIAGAGSSTSPRRAEDITVAKHMSLVALSNFLWWFPVEFMGLLSFGGHEISNDVYSWTTVIVFPINSAANPLLYMIPILMDKWEAFKFGSRRN